MGIISNDTIYTDAEQAMFFERELTDTDISEMRQLIRNPDTFSDLKIVLENRLRLHFLHNEKIASLHP